MNFAADTPDNERPLWQRRGLWSLIVLLVAIGYFGSYFQHGINFRDEGGTITLLAKRVHDGEIPFKDVVLGYNVGWFFPIAGLFELTGVNFVALRIYFFALSTIAALLGFITVERAARHGGLRKTAPILAFVVAVMLIVVPGMTFKNYNPLAAVANSWCLLGFVLAADSSGACRRALVGGLILGMTWLVRIDLGTFFTVIWLGAIFARLFDRDLKARLTAMALSLLFMIAGVALMHGPVLWDANRRGYLEPFLKAYPSQWVKLGKDLQKVAGLSNSPEAVKPAIVSTPALSPAKPATSTPPAPAAAIAAPSSAKPVVPVFPATPATDAPTATAAVSPAPAPSPAEPLPVAKPAPKPAAAPAPVALNTETLGRTTWNSVSEAKGSKREGLLGLFILTYLPLLSLVPLVLWAVVAWIVAVVKKGDTRKPLAALVLLGGALTMFPQYFFWRPDSPHLSEFGPGFWCGVAGASALLGAWSGRWFSPARLIPVLLVLHAGVWMWRMVPDRWCGTIAARFNRDVWFEGSSGVRIYEQQKTVDWLKEVQLTVLERSGESEFLIAYPYHPAFNIITNRPTYEKNVYVDNATAGPRWNADAIDRIESFRPKIVIISGWSPNGTTASRFKNWAGPVYQHVRSRYAYFGTFGDKKKDGTLAEEDAYEVFVRRADAIVPPKL